jgi:hypothetical protein
LFLHDNAPSHRTLVTQTDLPGLPMPWSATLLSGSDSVWLPPVPWTEKHNWKVSIFRRTLGSLLPRRPGWTNNFWFSWVV